MAKIGVKNFSLETYGMKLYMHKPCGMRRRCMGTLDVHFCSYWIIFTQNIHYRIAQFHMQNSISDGNCRPLKSRYHTVKGTERNAFSRDRNAWCKTDLVNFSCLMKATTFANFDILHFHGGHWMRWVPGLKKVINTVLPTRYHDSQFSIHARSIIW